MNENRTLDVYNLIILDESGSMEVIKNATIQGFNEVVQTIKGVKKQFPEQRHFVSFVTFNGLGIKTKLFNQEVSEIKQIDKNSYHPNASTPLFDAIGYSVLELERSIGQNTEYNVLVTILTDGEENASKEFTGKKIKQIIDKLKEKGWTFTYIGANHDVEKVAFSISISNTLKFDANEADVRRVFDRDKKARVKYYKKLRKKADVQDDYFEED